jgi:hypothetical protein
MKLPKTFLLIMILFQLNCFLDDIHQDKILNEETLDKMVGNWEKISDLRKNTLFGDNVEYEETYFPDSTYIQLTIKKNEYSEYENRGSWIEEIYSKIDSNRVSFPKNWNSISITEGGTKCYMSEGYGGGASYTVNFVEQNMELEREAIAHWYKKIYTPLK